MYYFGGMVVNAIDVKCPHCGAKVGARCHTPAGRMTGSSHASRVLDAERADSARLVVQPVPTTSSGVKDVVQVMVPTYDQRPRWPNGQPEQAKKAKKSKKKGRKAKKGK
jgi:hypothetical protein